MAVDKPGHSTHALPPESVLAVLPRVSDEVPPPAFVLCVRGEKFELGEGLSVAASAYAEAAFVLLKQLISRPDEAAWRACL